MDIPPVIDGNHRDAVLGVVDAVDHPVLAASGCALAGKLRMQLMADALWIVGQRAVDALDDRRGRDLLRQPCNAMRARTVVFHAHAERWTAC